MNNGFNEKKEYEAQDGTEYLLGSIRSTCLAQGINNLSFDELKQYFPQGEVQRSNKDDMQTCATGSPLNVLETKFNYLLRNNLLTIEEVMWLRENGYIVNKDNVLQFEFSDAFNAILSGTTREGNSLKSPLQSIHEDGLLPKKLLPLEDWMTFEEYHNEKRITPKMFYLASQFLERFHIKYEKVYDFSLNESLVTAVYAWSSPVNGIYERVEYGFNHAVDRARPKHFIFDTYYDEVDGDFIKEVAPDYKFLDYGYRLVISRNTDKKFYWFVPKFIKKLLT